MVIDINLLSLNSDGAFLTMIHSLIPQRRIISSTRGRKNHHFYLVISLKSEARLTYCEGVVPPVALTEEGLQVIRCPPDYH